MAMNSYSNRLSSYFPRCVIIGGLYGLLSPFLYVASLFVALFVLPWLTPSKSDFDQSFAVSNFLFSVVFLSFPITIAAIFIGMIDGVLVAIVLAISKNTHNNVHAGLLGFTIGLVFVLLINYFEWLSIPVDRSDYVVFSKYIFPSGLDFAHFISARNIYFLHSLIAVFLSTLGAWQVNRKVLEGHKAG